MRSLRKPTRTAIWRIPRLGRGKPSWLPPASGMRWKSGRRSSVAARKPDRAGDCASRARLEDWRHQSRVDLHCHTTASDGGLSAKDLVARAASMGIEVLAITDHDTTEGVPAALAEAQREGMVVVPGVEISTVSGREEIHLLGYFVDPDNPELQKLLALAREARRERAQKMLDRLAIWACPSNGIGWSRCPVAAVPSAAPRGSDVSGSRPCEQLR